MTRLASLITSSSGLLNTGAVGLESDGSPIASQHFIADVKEGRFAERSHLVEMDEKLLQEVISSAGDEQP